jgi:hypothetical protein
MTPIEGLEVVRLPVADVTEHPRNARRGDLETITESLQAHGQYAPIVVQKSTGHVIKGNHTLRAAEALGWTVIDAVLVDVDDDQALRILLVDNRSSDLGGYDRDGLASLLAGLDTLTGTGYDASALEDVRAVAAPPSATQESSAADDLPGWQEKGVRTVLLTYSIAEHGKVVAGLDALAARFDVDTYSAVVARLAADATR